MSFTATRAAEPVRAERRGARAAGGARRARRRRSRRDRAPALAAVTVAVPGRARPLGRRHAGPPPRRPLLLLRAARPRRLRARRARLRGRAGVARPGPLPGGRRARARPRPARRSRTMPARDPDRPAAAGPVFVGGFAFADERRRARPSGPRSRPASLVLPEVSFARHRGQARMTVSVVVQPDRAHVLDRMLARVAELEPASMPLIDPDPVQRTRVASAAPPAHYEQAVERAVERIRAGELEKVVLAREVRAHAARRTTPAPWSARCGTPSRPASAGASAPPSWPSSAPAPSCSCAATARAPRPSRSPAPRAAAPTRPWTTTSASSCCAASRTARSRRSSCAGSSARSSRSACG